jgi:hypothetical protein
MARFSGLARNAGKGTKMNRRDVQDLLRLIQRFVDGERIKPLADEIEGQVIECFQEEPWFEETSETLALFVPGGTTPYVDEEGLAWELAYLAAQLKAGRGEQSDEGRSGDIGDVVGRGAAGGGEPDDPPEVGAIHRLEDRHVVRRGLQELRVGPRGSSAHASCSSGRPDLWWRHFCPLVFMPW